MTHNLSLADPEWSKEAEVAFEVLRALRTVKEKSGFLLCAKRDRTSADIAYRWDLLQKYCNYIEAPVRRYCGTILKPVEAKLEEALHEIDQYNVDIESYDDDTTKMLEWEFDQYAEIVIESIKRDMTDAEKELFENNRDHA